MLWHTCIELKLYIWFCFTVLQIKFECRQFASIFVGVMPLVELRIRKIHSILHFFSYMLWHIELKFYIWLCFIVLHIKFCQFSSISVGVMLLSPLCFDILSWNFSYDFVQCTIYQVRVSSLCVRLALCLSIHFLHVPLTCIDKFSWNLEFDVGFLNVLF